MSEPTEVKRLRGDLYWVLSMENNDKLDALLDAVRAEERERCAKVAEDFKVESVCPADLIHDDTCYCRGCLTKTTIAAALREGA